MIHSTLEDTIGAPASLMPVSEWRLATVFDAAADAILVCTDGGDVVFFNQACERLFGCTGEQIIGRNVKALLRENPAGEDDNCGRLLRPSRTADTIWLRSFGGREFAAEVTASPATTAAGQHHLLIVREKLAPTAKAETEADAQAELVRIARMSAMEELSGALAHTTSIKSAADGGDSLSAGDRAGLRARDVR